MRTEPHPLSMTASGGKKIARRTLISDMSFFLYISGCKNTILSFMIQEFVRNISILFFAIKKQYAYILNATFSIEKERYFLYGSLVFTIFVLLYG